MISGAALSILLAMIILAFYVMDFYYMMRYDQQRQQQGKGWSWDYTLGTLFLGLVVLLQPIFFPRIALSVDTFPGKAMQVLGGVSVLLSFGLHIWSRQHLRHFYTERVEVQSGHQVINTGPYSLVRHPIIVSFFLLVVGILLINPGITTLLVLTYTIVDFSKAAQQEEKLLSNTVAGYDAYMKQTPRFIPRLWRGQ
ncbi:MAG: isoprenylcysteine carboxylmethyltransferase family protein [Chloroflexota bacterium]